VPGEDSMIASKHLKVQDLFLSAFADQQKANRFVSWKVRVHLRQTVNIDGQPRTQTRARLCPSM
jgi:hypothetical protein